MRSLDDLRSFEKAVHIFDILACSLARPSSHAASRWVSCVAGRP